MLNPAFNINHMREMIPIFYEVTHKVRMYPCPYVAKAEVDRHVQLRQSIENRVVKNGEAEINMVPWMGRTALELMGQAGLGYSFDSLTEEGQDSFGIALKSFV